jgi:hypothetical protein
MRAAYERDPRSFKGRFWRWHINWCPGWKRFMAGLDETARAEMKARYNLRTS